MSIFSNIVDFVGDWFGGDEVDDAFDDSERYYNDYRQRAYNILGPRIQAGDAALGQMMYELGIAPGGGFGGGVNPAGPEPTGSGGYYGSTATSGTQAGTTSQPGFFDIMANVGQGMDGAPQTGIFGQLAVAQGNLQSAQNPQYDYNAYVQNNPDLLAEYNDFANRPGGYGFGPNLPATYDRNGNGLIDIDEYGEFHYNTWGRDEERELPAFAGNGGGGGGGGGGSGGGPVDRFANFRNTPGYQFALQEGLRAIENTAGARGTLMSGDTLRAAADFSIGLADQTYGQYFDRLSGVMGAGAQAGDKALGVEENYAGGNVDLELARGGVDAERVGRGFGSAGGIIEDIFG